MAILYGDTFVDTNGVVLPSHTPTGSHAGLSWSRGPFATTDWQIEANGASVASASPLAHAVFNQSGTWPADVSIAFDIHFLTLISNAQPGPTARHSTTTDACYGVGYDGSGWYMLLFSTANPSVATALVSAAYAYPGNGVTDNMVFEVQGTALRLYKNGSLFLSTTDSTISAAGKPGLLDGWGATAPTATTGMHIENLLVSNFLAANPAVALTGTATASITESDIVTGGKTIILTLTDDTWRQA